MLTLSDTYCLITLQKSQGPRKEKGTGRGSRHVDGGKEEVTGAENFKVNFATGAPKLSETNPVIP
jgi:hypothetical protein